MANEQLNMPIIGSKALAVLLYGRTDIYMAWGIFPVAYPTPWTDTPPPIDTTATELLDEIGRRRVSVSAYVIPDVNGELTINGVKYSLSSSKTNYLWVKFSHEESDGGVNNICQLGIYLNVKPKVTVPPGQFYITKNDCDDIGDLFMLGNVPVFPLNPLTKEIWEFVLEF